MGITNSLMLDQDSGGQLREGGLLLHGARALGALGQTGPHVNSAQSVPSVHILLSTFNGAAYLHDQLASLTNQTHLNWILYWRDDGSSDATLEIMSQFTVAVGAHRCVQISEPSGRLLPAASFLALLRAVLPRVSQGNYVAFADQDDVWLPEKLNRAVCALEKTRADIPTLYCARLSVVDAHLERITETRISAHGVGFPASLTQNIATGCTIMMNREAASLVAGSSPPCTPFHDWWSYLLVTAAGGEIVLDDRAVALYRQHPANFVGMRSSQLRRAVAAIRRGPTAFMSILREHVAALVAQPVLVCDANYPVLLQIHRALQGNMLQRLRALCLPALRRQTRLETLLFRIWFLIG